MGCVVYIVEDTVVADSDTVLGEEQGNAKGRAKGFYFLALGTRITPQRLHRLFYFKQYAAVEFGEFLLKTFFNGGAGKAYLVRGHIRV